MRLNSINEQQKWGWRSLLIITHTYSIDLAFKAVKRPIHWATLLETYDMTSRITISKCLYKNVMASGLIRVLYHCSSTAISLCPQPPWNARCTYCMTQSHILLRIVGDQRSNILFRDNDYYGSEGYAISSRALFDIALSLHLETGIRTGKLFVLDKAYKVYPKISTLTCNVP